MYHIVTMGRKVLAASVGIVTIASSFLVVSLLPTATLAAGCQSGSLIKGSLHSVYYCGADGKRYVFTGEKSYQTWYGNFNTVITISDSALGSIPIGGNVTYRPGVKLVKIDTDPKTYAVARGGLLRWVTSETIASCLYGVQWNKKVDDIADAFYTNYTTGSPITNCSDYNNVAEMNTTISINIDKFLSPAN